MNDRPIAPTLEGRHRDGDHYGTSVSGCPLCDDFYARLERLLTDLNRDRGYARLSNGQLDAVIGVAHEILVTLEVERDNRPT